MVRSRCSLNESTMRRLNEGTIGHVKIDLGDCRLCEAAGKMGVTATACHPILKDGVLMYALCMRAQ